MRSRYGLRLLVAAVLLVTTRWLLPAATAEQPRVWDPALGLVLRGTIVTQDERRSIIEGGALCIRGNRIEAVLEAGQAVPESFAQATEIRTDGIILPGLINAHNHVAFSFLPIWETSEVFSNRYRWSNRRDYRRSVMYPKNLINEKRYFDLRIEAVKYGEIRCLIGGTTSVQGAPPQKSGFDKMLVRNIDYGLDVDDIYQRMAKVNHARFVREVRAGGGILANMERGEVSAWLVHLAEGVDERSRAEFDVLMDLGLVREETVVIHGTALGRDEFTAMAQAGTDLVWSPLSNRLLYGQTTDVILAREVGVNVSLASDWSVGGSKNLLGELKVADQIDDFEWGDRLSYSDLVDMVTVNPARALHWDDRLGCLKAGYYADVLVLDDRGDAYGSVVHASERNVKLVLVGGDPLYGDDEHMAILKGEDCEEIYNRGGRRKLIDVTRPGGVRSEETLDEIVGHLERALSFDPLDMRRRFRFTAEMDPEEFDSWFGSEFPGLEPGRLDPLFAEDDPKFFEAIRGSSNARMPYPLERFWQEADQPLRPKPRDEVSSGVIDGGWMAKLFPVHLYAAPGGRRLGNALTFGTRVEILGQSKVWMLISYVRVRAQTPDGPVEGWVRSSSVSAGAAPRADTVSDGRGLVDAIRDAR